MQIPYEVSPRPDTGLYNAKLGIWLFLASEVMLFGGLFSGYLFLRLGAEDGYWPQGLLNVPIGTLNTAVLIASSVTIVLTWANLKMRKWKEAQRYLLTTILCGVLFLFVKLVFEYPEKFAHFGAYIKKDSVAQYEQFLDNKGRAERGKPPRYEISGHLETVTVTHDPNVLEKMISDTEASIRDIDARLASGKESSNSVRELKKERKKLAKDSKKFPQLKFDTFISKNHLVAEAGQNQGQPVLVVKGHGHGHGPSPATAEQLAKLPGVKLIAFEVGMDPINADADNPDKKVRESHDHAHFWHKKPTDKIAVIQAKDVTWASSFAPKHNSYFAVYFTITALHGLHVLGGVLVMAYFYFFGEKIYRKNPEHQANRIEVVGLFWHFVDLVWIFVFPIFYLL